MKISLALEQFFEHLLLERGLAPATLSSYQYDLKQYRGFLAAEEIEDIDNISLTLVDKFIDSLRKEGLNPSSISRKISAIRTFHKFCLNEGLTETDPTESLVSRQPIRRLPKVIPSEIIDKLMNLPSDSGREGIRDKAMLELLYGCGLRISELVDLALGYLNIEDEIMRVVGKGEKTRIVPLGSHALKALNRYLEMGRPNFVKRGTDDKGRVFLNRFGEPLSRGGAYQIVKGYLKRAYPGKEYSPHTLRHSFATHILEGGANIRTVQELLGHESIATTQIYTHLDKSYLREVVRKYHPRG